MEIELLFFSGCPSWKQSLQYLNELVEENHLEVNIQLTRINSDADAVAHQFPGSPTIRVNGEDLFPVEHPDYRLGCRIYKTDNGFKGSPTKEMIKEKLDKF